MALNYAAYAKCKLSWRMIRETRESRISRRLEISNDTLRRARRTAKSRGGGGLALAPLVTRGCFRYICIIFMKPLPPTSGANARAARRRQPASVSREFAAEKVRERERKEGKKKRKSSAAVSGNPLSLRANPLRTSGRNFAVRREREIYRLPESRLCISDRYGR